MANNLQRMLQLVTEFFDTKNDPDQLQVTARDQAKLQAIHPATMSEYVEGDGPVVWILLIPTVQDVMERFLKAELSETQLLQQTPAGVPYDSIYLCSATVLPEYRRKGLAKKVTLEAISSIRKDNPVKTLFIWPFSEEGWIAAQYIARACELPLLRRPHDPHR